MKGIGFKLHKNNNQAANTSSRWHDPRMSSLFIKETEILVLELPIDELVGWLVVEGNRRAHSDFSGRDGRTWKNHSCQACF